MLPDECIMYILNMCKNPKATPNTSSTLNCVVYISLGFRSQVDGIGLMTAQTRWTLIVDRLGANVYS